MTYLLIMHILSFTLDGTVNQVVLHEFPSREACEKTAVETMTLVGLKEVKTKCVEVPSGDR